MSNSIRFLVLAFLIHSGCVYGERVKANENVRIAHKVSKSGLNRISNPPYKIVQVTGDESSFKIKNDEDGQNIYFMPLKKIGEKIEISIRNNAGFVQDLELEVSNAPGQTINIDGYKGKHLQKKDLNQTLSSMLKAMKLNRDDKFYVQQMNQELGLADGLSVMQTKLYQWQNLKGGVFIIKNNTKMDQILDLKKFASRFDNILVSYIDQPLFLPKEKRKVFIIQSGV